MAITIQAVTPPTKGRGRPKRLSDEHIQALLELVRNGQPASDGETCKRSAASQRGRAAREDLYAAGYEGKLVTKVWNTAGSKDDQDTNWSWAVEPK